MKKLILFSIFLLFHVHFSFSQLEKGDLAIVGFNSDISPDQMALVALSDIPSGQTIYISDYPWSGSSFVATSTTNGAITWTTTSTVPQEHY